MTTNPLPVLDQLDEAHAKATPGPWYLDPADLSASNEEGTLLFAFRDVVLVEDHPVGVQECTADAALIVAAVNALPRQAAAVRAALALADEVEARVQAAANQRAVEDATAFEDHILRDRAAAKQGAAEACIGDCRATRSADCPIGCWVGER